MLFLHAFFGETVSFINNVGKKVFRTWQTQANIMEVCCQLSEQVDTVPEEDIAQFLRDL